MGQIWRVELDRYSDESRAKSGRAFSIQETLDALIEKYDQQQIKPDIEVVTIGVGAAFADMLEARKIPFKRITGLLMRIDGADVFKHKGN